MERSSDFSQHAIAFFPRCVKCFATREPFQDLYYETSKKAKKDSRLKNSGELIGFQFFGEYWPTEPKTLFYDWVYLNALYRNKDLSQKVLKFSSFTDIEFNPEKSINCQAYSAHRDTPQMIGFLFATGAFSISAPHIHPQFAKYF